MNDHDHAGHDHAGQDHTGHDHTGHDHDHAGHDHAGHDHADHDHAGHDHAGHDTHSHSHTADGSADELAECPVMPGSTVNKADAEELGLFRDYEGTRYWFCCSACGPLWDAEPAKYANA